MKRKKEPNDASGGLNFHKTIYMIDVVRAAKIHYTVVHI